MFFYLKENSYYSFSLGLSQTPLSFYGLVMVSLPENRVDHKNRQVFGDQTRRDKRVS
jgi:hypothetical protein